MCLHAEVYHHRSVNSTKGACCKRSRLFLVFQKLLFGKDIEKAVAAYNESGNIQVFDTFFDKVLTRQLAQSSRKTSDVYLYTLISMDIDFYNILSVIFRSRKNTRNN